MSNITNLTQPSRGFAHYARLAARLLWIAIRLAAVLVIIRQGSTFFYQGF
jgi:hypothetical protein